ncbi:hypothetical protein QP028_11095 [Corynebacterium suedekumii]|nr:hypothetical protein QP028_11095 [Corynebacterium suedekumii]
MTDFNNLSRHDDYDHLLAAVEHGHHVPEAWLAYALQSSEKRQEQAEVAARVAADVKAARAAQDKRNTTRIDKARTDLPPMVEEYHAARDTATEEYAQAPVPRWRRHGRRTATRTRSTRRCSPTCGTCGMGRSCPGTRTCNVTATFCVHPNRGNSPMVDGELVVAPNPFRV